MNWQQLSFTSCYTQILTSEVHLYRQPYIQTNNYITILTTVLLGSSLMLTKLSSICHKITTIKKNPQSHGDIILCDNYFIIYYSRIMLHKSHWAILFRIGRIWSNRGLLVGSLFQQIDTSFAICVDTPGGTDGLKPSSATCNW